MTYEPHLDRTRFMEAIWADYAIRCVALEFVPIGFASACYIVEDDAGGRYFAKLWPSRHAVELDVPLRLVRALFDRGFDRCVLPPLPTGGGALRAQAVEGPYALFPYVDLPSPRSWPPELSQNFGRTVATIHLATPRLADVLPPPDPLDLWFDLPFQRGIERLERDARPGIRGLRDSLWPRRDEVAAVLGRLRELRASLLGSPGPRVLCHADLSSDNLLVAPSGSLVVLDWDEATLAPAEFDLAYALDYGFADALEGYRQAGGDTAGLRVERFAFDFLRRRAGATWARVSRILRGESKPEQDEADLQDIEMWGFARWRRLDESLEEIGRALERHRA